MMKRFGGVGSKKMKASKRKKGRKGKRGSGRVTPKGGQRAASKKPAGLSLPGLDEVGDLDLSDIPDLPGLK